MSRLVTSSLCNWQKSLIDNDFHWGNAALRATLNLSSLSWV